MICGAQSSGQPQSQARTLALGFARWTAEAMVVLTSAMMSAPGRSLQRGQDSWLKWEAQLVKFSEAVMVKTPARSGTFLKTCSREPESQRRTFSVEVHMAMK